MSDSAAYREVLSRIQSARPKLAPFFVNAVERAAALTALDAPGVRALGQLALVSEHTYVDVDHFVPLALARGELSLACRVLAELSAFDPAYARFVLARYPSLAIPLAEVSDDLLTLAASCARGAKKGERVLSFCLTFASADCARILIRQMRTVASVSPGALAEIVDGLPGIRAGLTEEAFFAWLSRGTDLLTSNRVDEGVRYLRARSAESRRLLGIPSAVLEDLRRVLTIYAASLAERELSVVSLDSSSFAIRHSYTDGRTMFLPPEIRLFDRQEDNERVYTVLAAQQAAAVAMGTFGLDRGAMDFQDELRERYGTALPPIMANVRKQYGKTARTIRERASGDVEAVFPSGRRLLLLETEHEKLFYSFPAPDLARELFGLVETARIQRALSSRYPGLAEDYALLGRRLWKGRPALPDPGADAGARLRTALECLVQFTLAGRWKCVVREAPLETRIAEIVREWEQGLASARTVEDSARVCFRLYNLFHDNFPVIPFCETHDVREIFPKTASQELLPEVTLDVSPDLMAKAEKREAPGTPGEQTVRDIDITQRGVTDRKAQRIRDAVATGALRVFRYPEFDANAGSYRQSHCTLYERELESRRDEYYRGVLAAQKMVHERMRKRFLAMRPEGVELTRHWLSGDEIHLGDAVDYLIDLLRGACPEETIYFRKVTNQRDIVAAVVIDASSSTAEQVNGRAIIEVERASLAILASALSRIGDDFGVFSYHSQGRHRVFFDVVKDFAEPWNERTQGRISSILPQAANRDGCAIRHAAARLSEQPHRTKLLLLLSDGVPADVDYGAASSAETSPYAIEDTRRAILECRMKGIVPYCITVDRAAKDYVSHLYGDYHYTVIDDVSVLPERLARLYLRFTA